MNWVVHAVYCLVLTAHCSSLAATPSPYLYFRRTTDYGQRTTDYVLLTMNY